MQLVYHSFSTVVPLHCTAVVTIQLANTRGGMKGKVYVHSNYGFILDVTQEKRTKLILLHESHISLVTCWKFCSDIHQ